MTKPYVLVIHGPNLNLLGQREPHIYGHESLADHIATVRAILEPSGYGVIDFQSNTEGDVIDQLHTHRTQASGLIFNPGAFTHYAWGIHDALASFSAPVVELHLSNPARRETWRHTSVVSPVASATIAGFGAKGYELAAEGMKDRLNLAG